MVERLRVFRHIGFFCSWRRKTFATIERGYDGQIFLDELARLERAALGNTIYGNPIFSFSQEIEGWRRKPR